MIESIPLVLTGLGLTASILYYTMVLRNTNEAQKRAQETRRTQLSTSITERIGSKDFLRDFIELAQLEWIDVDDFLKKYDHRVNTESYAQRWTI